MKDRLCFKDKDWKSIVSRQGRNQTAEKYAETEDATLDPAARGGRQGAERSSKM